MYNTSMQTMIRTCIGGMGTVAFMQSKSHLRTFQSLCHIELRFCSCRKRKALSARSCRCTGLNLEKQLYPVSTPTKDPSKPEQSGSSTSSKASPATETGTTEPIAQDDTSEEQSASSDFEMKENVPNDPTTSATKEGPESTPKHSGSMSYMMLLLFVISGVQLLAFFILLYKYCCK